MKLIYVHGLDSSANSVKGVLLQQYCKEHHPTVKVFRPDLNESPDMVFARLCRYVNESGLEGNEKIVLIGSSLGGYFASLVSNETGCSAVLLNPSTKPHISLQRFIDEQTLKPHCSDEATDTVVYRTSGGWALTLNDLAWFSQHKLEFINHPKHIFAVIKKGDELLDANVAITFYQSQRVKVAVQQGGDHRMTDFEQQLPMIMSEINRL